MEHLRARRPGWACPQDDDRGGWHEVGRLAHAESFSMAATVLPAVIALIAENTGHVKAVAEMTGRDLDPDDGTRYRR